jgi:eukaryotic-like serine/threonine-protein kinase
MKDNIIKFLKSKDFLMLEELGRGACGKTVKLYDEVIKETFVCKKYEPFNGEQKEELFGNFIQEIKLLYLLNHNNVVRVFTYYIYP